MFELQIGQVQCKHILFGGSADNGYARLFAPYSNNESVRNRVTLVEGPRFEAELLALVDKFHTTSFPDVFRDKKIPPRRVSFSTTPPKSVSPKSSWAQTVKTPPAGPEQEVVRATTPPARPVDPVGRNRQGQRVDRPIKASQLLVTQLKAKKLCNQYYLMGICGYSNCNHNHDEKLNSAHLAALRLVARLTPCAHGLECDDDYCFAGHRCPRERCNLVDCWYSREMHNVDTRIVN